MKLPLPWERLRAVRGAAPTPQLTRRRQGLTGRCPAAAAGEPQAALQRAGPRLGPQRRGSAGGGLRSEAAGPLTSSATLASYYQLCPSTSSAFGPLFHGR